MVFVSIVYNPFFLCVHLTKWAFTQKALCHRSLVSLFLQKQKIPFLWKLSTKILLTICSHLPLFSLYPPPFFSFICFVTLPLASLPCFPSCWSLDHKLLQAGTSFFLLLLLQSTFTWSAKNTRNFQGDPSTNTTGTLTAATNSTDKRPTLKACFTVWWDTLAHAACTNCTTPSFICHNSDSSWACRQTNAALTQFPKKV